MAAELSEGEVNARLMWRLLTHEAAHAVTCWLVGGRVRSIGPMWIFHDPIDDPVRSALVSLAGPAMDGMSLDWATPADAERPAWIRHNDAIASDLQTRLRVTPRDDDRSKARRALSEDDPVSAEQRYASMMRAASRLIEYPSVQAVIDAVAVADIKDEDAFLAVVEPHERLREWMSYDPIWEYV